MEHKNKNKSKNNNKKTAANSNFKKANVSNSPGLSIINFATNYEPPKNVYSIGKGYILWGSKNLHPNYLIDLYNYKGSVTHQSAIDRKTDLIAGRGFEHIEDETLRNLVERIKLPRQVKRAALDGEIINGMAFEVIYTNDGEAIASIKHIPIHKLRVGIESDEIPYSHFLYSNDWREDRLERNKPVPIKEWNSYDTTGKSIYVYYDYNPDSDQYCIPNYSNSYNYIELDHEISKFHLNQVKKGFAPSMLINFSTGRPTPEEMEEFNDDFRKKYEGADGEKLIITYSDGVDEQPLIEAMQLNDSDGRFIMLNAEIEKQIIRGSRIPPQLLMLEAGKLGGNAQRAELLSEFQSSYVTPRQEIIEDVLNDIFEASGFTEKIRLKQYEIVVTEQKTEEKYIIKED